MPAPDRAAPSPVSARRRLQRALAHGGPIDREQLSDLVIAASALQHELQHRALIGREIVEGGHRVQRVVEGAGGTRAARGRQARLGSGAGVIVGAVADTDPFLQSRGFDAFYGLELLELGAESAHGRLVVREEHKQPFGLVHGGIYAAIAEGLTSFSTVSVVLHEGKVASWPLQPDELPEAGHGRDHRRARDLQALRPHHVGVGG